MMELLEILFVLLEALVGAEELICYWRFSITLILSVALAALFYQQLPWDTANFIISVSTAIAGMVGGAIWEHSHRRF